MDLFQDKICTTLGIVRLEGCRNMALLEVINK
jgi:hypothetical protein